eukprot:2267905-Amphidinium_carterae.2
MGTSTGNDCATDWQYELDGPVVGSGPAAVSKLLAAASRKSKIRRTCSRRHKAGSLPCLGKVARTVTKAKHKRGSQCRLVSLHLSPWLAKAVKASVKGKALASPRASTTPSDINTMSGGQRMVCRGSTRASSLRCRQLGHLSRNCPSGAMRSTSADSQPAQRKYFLLPNFFTLLDGLAVVDTGAVNVVIGVETLKSLDKQLGFCFPRNGHQVQCAWPDSRACWLDTTM